MENHLENLTNGNISKWSKETSILIKKYTLKKKNLCYIGSSMGAWIRLRQFKIFQKTN